MKNILRRLKGDFTGNELYSIGKFGFHNRKIPESTNKENITLAIDNLFLRIENKKLYKHFILSR